MKRWPLLHIDRAVHTDNHPGSFGAIRKYDIHTGVDLYCYENTPVIAVEEGVVISIEDFTGSKADSPWWNDTQAVLVRGPSGVICYGEVSTHLTIGAKLNAGNLIGNVVPVLKKDKGIPQSMLHFELYTNDFKETVWWYHGEPQPSTLLDPTKLLLSLI